MSMLTDKREKELVSFTQKMIQAPSYSGQESKVVEEMKAF